MMLLRAMVCLLAVATVLSFPSRDGGADGTVKALQLPTTKQTVHDEYYNTWLCGECTDYKGDGSEYRHQYWVYTYFKLWSDASDTMDGCEVKRCTKCGECDNVRQQDCTLRGCYSDLTETMVCPERATPEQRIDAYGDKKMANVYWGACPYQLPGNWRYKPVVQWSSGLVTECQPPSEGDVGYGTNEVYRAAMWGTCTEAHVGLAAVKMNATE
jgi:hypothetical protein